MAAKDTASCTINLRATPKSFVLPLLFWSCGPPFSASFYYGVGVLPFGPLYLCRTSCPGQLPGCLISLWMNTLYTSIVTAVSHINAYSQLFSHSRNQFGYFLSVIAKRTRPAGLSGLSEVTGACAYIQGRTGGYHSARPPLYPCIPVHLRSIPVSRGATET